MTQTIEIPVYRAITGSGKFANHRWTHEGVSDERLAKRGIFCDNRSFAQYSSPPSSTGPYLRVPGLPVFLNFDEAVFWVDGKEYETAPAIVEAQLTTEHLFGNNRRIRLVRNYWNKAEGYEPTNEEIQNHLTGKEIIRGECFLQGVNGNRLEEQLHHIKRIYRPNKTQDGRFDVKEGFKVTEPAQE
ncbi:hypothetical protein COU61_00650 [Candidatus Pacearchaeota archaeon CG10_big_fil_rev_8_21_14_0_10_35_13]|nr:MAG: hypothetical protein COU61_00650 [Candidatus Pacearchaeota archaeon CG10_big_fil_rev_8_21_14_0_10_35_13]